MGRPARRQVLLSQTDVLFQHLFPDFCPVLALVRPLAHGEFIEDDPKGIEVGGVGVVFLEQDLRGHIDRGSAGLITDVACFIGFLLGYSEVSQPRIPIFFEDDVFGLQVLMNDAHRMDVFEGNQNAADDKP